MLYELGQGHREAALAQYKAAHDILVGNLGGVKLDANGRSPEEVLRQSGWNGLDVTKPYNGIEANIAKLAKINQTELQKASADVSSKSTVFILALALALALVLVVALALSVRYIYVTHRLLNPGFVIALMVSIAAVAGLVFIFIKANDDYKTISKDSFTTIEAASQARQVLLAFNGDESRILLSPTSTSLDSTNSVLTPEVRKAFDPKALEEGFTQMRTEFEKQVGLAWQNVNYSGERTSLCAILDNPKPTREIPACADREKPTDRTGKRLPFAWPEYLTQHDAIIKNFKDGLLAQSINISFGPSNDQANRVLDSLKVLSDTNKKAFDDTSCNTVGQAQFRADCGGQTGYLNLLQTLNWVAFPLIIITALAGALFARRLF